MNANSTLEQQVQDLKRGAEHIVPEGGLAEKLELAERENRQLRVKLGVDPTRCVRCARFKMRGTKLC